MMKTQYNQFDIISEKDAFLFFYKLNKTLFCEITGIISQKFLDLIFQFLDYWPYPHQNLRQIFENWMLFIF